MRRPVPALRGSVVVTIKVVQPMKVDEDTLDVTVVDQRVIDMVIAFCRRNRIRCIAPPVHDGDI